MFYYPFLNLATNLCIAIYFYGVFNSNDADVNTTFIYNPKFLIPKLMINHPEFGEIY